MEGSHGQLQITYGLRAAGQGAPTMGRLKAPAKIQHQSHAGVGVYRARFLSLGGPVEKRPWGYAVFYSRRPATDRPRVAHL